MGYTSQQLIQFIHSQGYSDQDIANVVEATRETVTRIRLGKPGYHGQKINDQLVSIVRQLQEQEQGKQEEPQRGQPQAAPPVQKPRPPQAAPPVQHPPQVRQALPGKVQPKNPTTLYEQFYCLGCTRVYPPTKLSPQEFKQWAKSHPCEWKKQGRCQA